MNSTSSPSPRVLLVGTGHLRLSDDGLGWHAARMLARSFSPEEVHLLVDERLRAELAHEVAGCALVIFLRARHGKRPGTIRCERVEISAGTPPIDSDDLTPDQLLLLAREQFGVEPEAWSVTVAGTWWGPGEDLSPCVRVALPDVQTRIDELVNARRREATV